MIDSVSFEGRIQDMLLLVDDADRSELQTCMRSQNGSIYQKTKATPQKCCCTGRCVHKCRRLYKHRHANKWLFKC